MIKLILLSLINISSLVVVISSSNSITVLVFAIIYVLCAVFTIMITVVGINFLPPVIIVVYVGALAIIYLFAILFTYNEAESVNSGPRNMVANSLVILTVNAICAVGYIIISQWGELSLNSGAGGKNNSCVLVFESVFITQSVGLYTAAVGLLLGLIVTMKIVGSHQ